MPLIVIFGALAIGAWLYSNASIPTPGTTPPVPPGGTPIQTPFDPTNATANRTDWVPGPTMQIATYPVGGIAVVSNHLPLAPSDVTDIENSVRTVDSTATFGVSKNPYQLDVFGHRTDPVLNAEHVIQALHGGNVRGLSVNGIAVDL